MDGRASANADAVVQGKVGWEQFDGFLGCFFWGGMSLLQDPLNFHFCDIWIHLEKEIHSQKNVQTRTQQPSWPRYVLGSRSWAENTDFPLYDYVLRKTGNAYGARVPAGTLLKPLQHAYNSTGLAERRDGVAYEHQVFCMAVDVAQGTWVTNRSRASSDETELISGLDPAFQSALDGSLTSEVRLFATLLGLNSFLLTSPNEVVAALTHMRRVPEQLNLSAMIFQCFSLERMVGFFRA